MPLPKDPQKAALTRERMRQAHLGKTIPPEQRAKIAASVSKAKKGVSRPDMRGDGNPMKRPEIAAKMGARHKGKTITPEQRERIATSLTGRKASPRTRRKMQKQLPSYKAAHRRLDTDYGPIATQLCGVCGQPARHWALLHEAELVERNGRGCAYSLNPEDYLAMCILCHRRYDRGSLSI